MREFGTEFRERGTRPPSLALLGTALEVSCLYGFTRFEAAPTGSDGGSGANRLDTA